ncbi:MAG: WG repeat-containing protein [Mobilitalea sp.]
MKKTFITLITILLILVIGAGIYFKIRADKASTESEANNNPLTGIPTEALLPTQAPLLSEAPLPTITATPVKNSSLFLAYQNINDEIKYGYIDETGLFVIQPAFDFAQDFNDGVAVVTINNIYCVIDTDGNIIFTNEMIEDFHNGMAIFATFKNDSPLYGYIDTTGKVIIEPQYRLASSFKEDNSAYVSTGSGKYARIDKTGTVLETFELDSKYDNWWRIDDGYIVYNDSEKNKFGAINVKGEIIFEPIYSDIKYLGHDLFAIKEPDFEYFYEIENAPAAIYNQKGEQLTDYSLYDLIPYYGDYSSATDSTSTYFVGLDGKEVTTLPKFEGRGTLKLLGDVVKADIDSDVIYSQTDGTIIWQSDHSYTLANGVIIRSEKLKPNKYVSVNYPQIEGLTDADVQITINDELRRIFTENRLALNEDDMLSVEDTFQTELINNLLIIKKEGYDYPFGAAHGMPLREYYYIDLTTGVFYEFSDLFKEDSDYITKINDLIGTEIKIQSENEDSMIFLESFVGISEKPGFILSEDAITIYFYPYEIAAYAAGFPEFVIPFEDISEYIDKSGKFWGSFH